jgi:hypothetical protein
MMEARAVLRDASKLLLTIGAINLALSTGLQLATSGSQFTFNFGLFVGAAMLWTGNLRAASLVRWFACAYLGIALFWMYAIARQPLDLSINYLKLYPFQVLALCAIEILTWLACLGLARHLGREEIMRARQAAGKRRRDMRIPFVLGCLGSVIGMVLMSYLLTAPRTERAESLARQSAGPGYRYYTESMQILWKKPTNAGVTGKQVNASVAVWNKDLVYHMPVSWREP